MEKSESERSSQGVTIKNQNKLLAGQPQSLFIRFLAHFFSFLFHPLFIPAYLAAFLIYLHPYAFSDFNRHQKLLRLISVVLITGFFPAFTVFLLRRLGFASTIFLRTQKERIIPYVASMFFYF